MDMRPRRAHARTNARIQTVGKPDTLYLLVAAIGYVLLLGDSRHATVGLSYTLVVALVVSHSNQGWHGICYI